MTRIDFPSLPAASFHPRLAVAQRFLASAYDSVEDLFDWHQGALDLAAEDLAEDPEYGLRTHETAQDMLRSMIVFSGAGIDATVKQLIRDALVDVVSVSSDARLSFERFTAAAVDPNQPGAAKRLAKYLTSDSSRAAIIEDYARDLTGGSLQSVEQLDRAMSALGLSDPLLRRQAKALKPLFEARNQIVHELDLLQPGTDRERHRRRRSTGKSMELAHLGLETAQQLVNAVAALLPPPDSPDINVHSVVAPTAPERD